MRRPIARARPIERPTGLCARACRPLPSCGGGRAALGACRVCGEPHAPCVADCGPQRRVSSFAPAKEAAPAFLGQSSVLSCRVRVRRGESARRKNASTTPVCASRHFRARGVIAGWLGGRPHDRPDGCLDVRSFGCSPACLLALHRPYGPRARRIAPLQANAF